jgi:hypothetical protein
LSYCNHYPGSAANVSSGFMAGFPGAAHARCWQRCQ